MRMILHLCESALNPVICFVCFLLPAGTRVHNEAISLARLSAEHKHSGRGLMPPVTNTSTNNNSNHSSVSLPQRNGSALHGDDGKAV